MTFHTVQRVGRLRWLTTTVNPLETGPLRAQAAACRPSLSAALLTVYAQTVFYVCVYVMVCCGVVCVVCGQCVLSGVCVGCVWFVC